VWLIDKQVVMDFSPWCSGFCYTRAKI